MGPVSGKRQRTGVGEIVPREYAASQGRNLFFEVLCDLTPEPLNELRGQSFRDAFAWSKLEREGEETHIVCADPEKGDRLIRDWQARWRLSDEWAYEAAFLVMTTHPETVIQAERLFGVKIKTPSGFVAREADLYQYRPAGLRVTIPEEHTGILDLLDGYDPRSETVEQATARVLPSVEERVRAALRYMSDQDRTDWNIVNAQPLPARQHLEWTVRYQCLGESFGKITRDEGLSNENNWVSEKVHEVANLIGLTLREPDKGGRPRKQPPARNSRCIAIPHKRENPCPEQ